MSLHAAIRGAICAAAMVATLGANTAGGSENGNAQARRIVAVGGAITEIVYALGLQDRLAGIDSTSLYPPEALQQKPNVGYMRQLSAEGVLGLNPELILAAEGAGPKDTLSVLSAAKVPIVAVRFADRVVVLHHGRLASSGSPRETITNAMLRNVFEVETNVDLIAGPLPHVLPQAMQAV